MGLYDAMGGREWARGIGARLEVPATDRVVRLVLPEGRGPNRATVQAGEKGAGLKVVFGRVDGDDGEEMGTFEEPTASAAARLIGELVAASRPKREAAKRTPELEPAEV